MSTDVAHYYDRNTPLFLPHRKALLEGGIHRRLRVGGLGSDAQVSHELVLGQLREFGARRILDLGCGVGGSIRYLKRRHEGEFRGITISPVQVEAARNLGTALEVADFQDPAWFAAQEAFDVFYAIESIQHNPDHDRLAAHLALVSHPGTRLVVIDDFLAPGVDPGHPLVERFRRAWHAHGFTTAGALAEALGRAGFRLQGDTDLSALVPKRPVLRVLGTLVSWLLRALAIRGAYADNLVGGNALLRLQRRSLARYAMLVFVREAGA